MSLPEPRYSDATNTLHVGDCLDVLAAMPHASVDAVVTDPPYGLEFMGQGWDAPWKGDTRQRGDATFTSGNRRHGLVRHGIGGSYGGDPRESMRAFQAWCESWATECLRVLKPGAHLVAFGGTRTYHRLACAVEDAGFEVRDQLQWLYGSGFPKSAHPRNGMHSLPRSTTRAAFTRWYRDVRTYATGSALKPAHEPIVLARRPLTGTVAGTVLEHGTGALNIDGSRIPIPAGDGWDGRVFVGRNAADNVYGTYATDGTDQVMREHPQGRWPANVVLGCACHEPHERGCAAAMLDQQSGEATPKPERAGKRGGNGFGCFDDDRSAAETGVWPADPGGGASRFFYCAKASQAERDAANSHPTVKPVELMRWLIRLVTPPGGVVLDPFAGSGTTAVAATVEGRRCVLVEREPCGGCERGCPDYAGIIVRRLSKPIEPTLGFEA